MERGRWNKLFGATHSGDGCGHRSVVLDEDRQPRAGLYSFYNTYGYTPTYAAMLSPVTSGNNDWTDAHSHTSYTAASGWNAATGLGIPVATGLLCPQPTSSSSNSATPGTSVTITGTDLANSTVSFGSTPATITSSSLTTSPQTLTVTVPNATGSAPITVDNTIGDSTPIAFAYPAPTITSGNSATSTVGSAFNFSVTTDGSPTPTLSVTSGTLPSGLTFTDNGNGTATIAGTPSATSGGSYTFTITAANSNGSTPQSFTLTNDEAPSITSANSKTFVVNQVSSFTVTTGGYPVPTITITTDSGQTGVPGVSFSNGVLSGTPTATGTYTIGFQASNSVSTATQTFTLVVGQAPTITSASSFTFTVGNSGTFSFQANGYPSPTWSETGPLTGTVSLASNGLLSGTPTASGVYPITVTASNGVTPDATQDFTLYVDGPPSISVPSSETPIVGVPGTYTISTGGYPSGGACIHQSGTLPPGLSFSQPSCNGTATVTGTTTQTGSFTANFYASDAYGNSSTESMTFNVESTPSVSAPSERDVHGRNGGFFLGVRIRRPVAQRVRVGRCAGDVVRWQRLLRHADFCGHLHSDVHRLQCRRLSEREHDSHGQLGAASANHASNPEGVARKFPCSGQRGSCLNLSAVFGRCLLGEDQPHLFWQERGFNDIHG